MCRYAPEESTVKLKAETEVAFEWSCQGPHINATYVHKMLCKNAVSQNIPFPSHWRTAIPFAAEVQKLLRDATAHASRKAENPIVTCKLLGIPVDDDRLDALCGDGSGSLVSLQGASMEVPRDFLLVAQVHEDTWICHSGSNANGSIDEVHPFDLNDLEAKNIRQARSPGEKKPARDLLNAAESNPSAWSAARAYALWLAEEIRADGGAFRLDQARAGFESNPFQWKTSKDERFSQQQVGFLWSWECRGQLRHSVNFVRMNNLFAADRHIPRPEALKGPWEIWRSRLEDAAAKHFACKYLGMEVGHGFEPDPKKWKVGPEQDKTFTKVWYEWEHVTRGIEENKPHRVQVIVNNIVHGNKGIPHHPCLRSCPRELRFTLEYMQGFAKWKSAGAEYVGISYESERPAFQCELPDGGMDIQDHPVYWHFANSLGLYSLRELCAMSENQFELHCVDEPYLVIAEKIGWLALGICENEVHLAEYDLSRSCCVSAHAPPVFFRCLFYFLTHYRPTHKAIYSRTVLE